MINKRFDHRLVLSLALPMILSNISTPLLGLVDTAVLGHLDSELILSAVALGGVIFSFICYLFDGVFIGAMMTKAMRNIMLFSLFIVLLPVWYFTQDLGNHGLWLAMSVFMLARGLSMMVVFKIAG